ncbi:MAG: FAD-binding oxidoreductase [Thermomicrobiales bacterium]
MTQRGLIERLRRIVGERSVFHEPADLLVYEYDGSVDGAVETAPPLAVVLPRTSEQVSAIVRLAREINLPVVARGAGTGLSGGAVAQSGGIIVALTRMDRILSVDLVAGTALVEPGVINLELSEWTARDGYFFAPDPSSQRACTIGGNVAENSGGPHCLKYGVTTNHVLGLEVVLQDGRIAWVGGAATGGAGYDMTSTMVGSEGMLGIVTKALVKLTPMPEATAVMLAAFGDVDAASLAVSKVIGAGIIPAALEMMDALTIEAVEPQYHAGYPMDAAAVLLIEIDGIAEDVAATVEEVRLICLESEATEVRIASRKAEKDLLWKGRKMALAAMGRLSPNYYLHDTVVPRTKLPATLRRVAEISRDFDLRIANVFHAGDGNLHPLMLFDRHKAGDVERVLEASKEILTYCVEVGGALSGEHGIGTEKRDYMTLVYSADDLAAMAGVKNSFDPRGMFNPEKMFPKGYMCGEVRALRAQALAQKHGIHAL